MICHRIDKAAEALGVIEKLPRKQINRALASVAAFKNKMQPPTKFSEGAFRKLDDAVWKLRVAVLGKERAAERSPENAARSPVERPEICILLSPVAASLSAELHHWVNSVRER